MSAVHAGVALVASAAYLSSVFRLRDSVFWTTGLGDWIDPYFINYLLEHWHHSFWQMTDPASPPMYYPARGTLGYSHGLVLYVPFYLVLRLLFHPFQAYNLTLFLVLEVGALCLFLVFRRSLALSFLESFLLTAFFVTSPNVVNGYIGVWSQRASVFLIPPILLLAVTSLRRPAGPLRLALAALSGLLALLLFTQDFYTAQFALFFAALGSMAARLSKHSLPAAHSLSARWAGQPFMAKAALLTAIAAGGWAIGVWISGGASVSVLGLRIASRDWRRPAAVALAGLAVLVSTARGISARTLLRRIDPWARAFASGALIAVLWFLWIYWPSYREHPFFPEDQIVGQLGHYESMRPFALAFPVAALAWIPFVRRDRRTGIHASWLAAVSLVVLFVPLRFHGFSVWMSLFHRVPGFSAIRDPKRIIEVYELALVLAVGALASHLPKRSIPRISAALLALGLVLMQPNGTRLDFLRPREAFARWVEAPIAADEGCRSFFVKAATREYGQRTGGSDAVYSIDAMFIALNISIPTLNGYSAWSPEGWNLASPEAPGYASAVSQWIERHHLNGVCVFDVEKRTMAPYAVR